MTLQSLLQVVIFKKCKNIVYQLLLNIKIDINKR